MARAGHPVEGGSRQRIARLVRHMERHGGRLEWPTVARMFDLTKCNARIWRNRARAAYRAKHGPVSASALSMAATASRANLARRALKEGIDVAA